MYIRRPTAADSAAIRKLLKDNLIAVPMVRLSLWSVHVGNQQCSWMDSAAALQMIELLEANGYVISMRDCATERIAQGIFDNCLVQIPA